MGQNIANSPYKEFILFDKEVIFFYILIPEKKRKPEPHTWFPAIFSCFIIIPMEGLSSLDHGNR